MAGFGSSDIEAFFLLEAAQGDDLSYGERPSDDRALRDVGEASGTIVAREVCEGLGVKLDMPGGWFQSAHQEFEEGGLADAIRPDDGGDGCGGEGGREVAKDGRGTGIGEGEVGGGEGQGGMVEGGAKTGGRVVGTDSHPGTRENQRETIRSVRGVDRSGSQRCSDEGR